MSVHTLRFDELLEMIDRLSLDERESLVDVVRKRNSDDARALQKASVLPSRNIGVDDRSLYHPMG